MTAENEGRTRADALMAAITDEPLTDEARADAAFMAEHRSAAADVALLREQLGIIGHALAEPAPPEPEPQPAPAPAPVRVRRPSRARRRMFAVAYGGLAVAAAASVLVGMGWLLTQGEGAHSDAGAAADKQASEAGGGGAFGSPQYLACSRLVAEGEATSVERLPGTTSLRVALHMSRYYKPDKGEQELTFVVDESLVPGLRVGDPVLIGIRQGTREPDFWAVGEQNIAPERAWITASLAQAGKLTC
ncbi:hypothetical protein [Streptomyces caeruleatus]|uniref:Uncharacterized protein n=1 Tax=Streptomyces caeruleatus TaxID=661399 RepID=A0A124I9G1_9ACTN|nr:hypothetical protein [Streptomyces caeruleatus]KUO02420.1 hypothetical protein AQJ67_21495 [Streptomyces caeruleatus]